MVVHISGWEWRCANLHCLWGASFGQLLLVWLHFCLQKAVESLVPPALVLPKRERKSLTQAEVLSTYTCMIAKIKKKKSGKKSLISKWLFWKHNNTTSNEKLFPMPLISWWSFYPLEVIYLHLKFLISEWYTAGNSLKHLGNDWPTLQGHKSENWGVGPNNNHILGNTGIWKFASSDLGTKFKSCLPFFQGIE